MLKHSSLKVAGRRSIDSVVSESPVASPQSDTGWDSSTQRVGRGGLGEGLSEQDRRLARVMQKRPSMAAGDDEEQVRPLSSLQKVVQAGKPLGAVHEHVCGPGLEGLCCAINPHSDTVAVGCRDSRLLLLDLATLRLQAVHDLSGSKVAALTAVRYRPDGFGGTSNVAYMAQGSNILTIHVSRGHVLDRRQELDNNINALALRPAGTPMLASAGVDKVVRVYDEATGKQTATLDHGDDINCCGHSNLLHAVNWKPNDPNVLVSGGWDRKVNIWDLRLARAVRSVSGPYICGGDNLDMRENELVTGSWRHENPLQLWDFGTGKLLTNCPFYQPEMDACKLYAAKFTPGPTDLIVAGGSGKKPCVKAFQTNGQVIGTMALPSGMNAMASSPTWTDKLRSVVLCCADRIMLLHL